MGRPDKLAFRCRARQIDRHGRNVGRTRADADQDARQHKEITRNIWQITAGGDADSLYVGVAPAALFESHDGGATWQLNKGLWSHPHRKRWTPGFGGLCLHTIVTDAKNPNDLKVAISTGGVYQSKDGGKSWTVTNKGVSAYFNPDPYPEFGQCVHKIARHPRKKGLFFLQNHHGVYRSRDGAQTWQEIENGLPSNFGFGLTVSDAGSVFIVPLQKGRRAFYVRRQASRLSHTRRRQIVATAHKRPAAKKCVRSHPPRCGRKHRQQHLFRYQKRQAVWVVERRRFVEANRRLATRDLLREGL